MRTVICAATATIFLGLGMALLLQATEASSEAHNATLEQTRPPSASLEATLEPTPTPSGLQPILKAHYAIAAAPDDVSAVTMPIAYRQVRTVSIIEPTEAAPKNAGAPPAETSRTDYHAVEASPGAAVEEDRSAAAPNAKATAATQDVTSPQQPSEEDVSSGPSRNASHGRKHSRRERRKAQVATAQQPPAAIPAPAAPASAYTVSNETPFHSLGQLFSGGR
jgi:hypothetical protein